MGWLNCAAPRALKDSKTQHLPYLTSFCDETDAVGEVLRSAQDDKVFSSVLAANSKTAPLQKRQGCGTQNLEREDVGGGDN